MTSESSCLDDIVASSAPLIISPPKDIVKPSKSEEEAHLCPPALPSTTQVSTCPVRGVYLSQHTISTIIESSETFTRLAISKELHRCFCNESTLYVTRSDSQGSLTSLPLSRRPSALYQLSDVLFATYSTDEYDMTLDFYLLEPASFTIMPIHSESLDVAANGLDIMPTVSGSMTVIYIRTASANMALYHEASAGYLDSISIPKPLSATTSVIGVLPSTCSSPFSSDPTANLLVIDKKQQNYCRVPFAGGALGADQKYISAAEAALIALEPIFPAELHSAAFSASIDKCAVAVFEHFSETKFDGDQYNYVIPGDALESLKHEPNAGNIFGKDIRRPGLKGVSVESLLAREYYLNPDQEDEPVQPIRLTTPVETSSKHCKDLLVPHVFSPVVRFVNYDKNFIGYAYMTYAKYDDEALSVVYTTFCSQDCGAVQPLFVARSLNVQFADGPALLHEHASRDLICQLYQHSDEVYAVIIDTKTWEVCALAKGSSQILYIDTVSATDNCSLVTTEDLFGGVSAAIPLSVLDDPSAYESKTKNADHVPDVYPADCIETPLPNDYTVNITVPHTITSESDIGAILFAELIATDKDSREKSKLFDAQLEDPEKALANESDRSSHLPDAHQPQPQQHKPKAQSAKKAAPLSEPAGKQPVSHAPQAPQVTQKLKLTNTPKKSTRPAATTEQASKPDTGTDQEDGDKKKPAARRATPVTIKPATHKVVIQDVRKTSDQPPAEPSGAQSAVAFERTDQGVAHSVKQELAYIRDELNRAFQADLNKMVAANKTLIQETLKVSVADMKIITSLLGTLPDGDALTESLKEQIRKSAFYSIIESDFAQAVSNSETLASSDSSRNALAVTLKQDTILEKLAAMEVTVESLRGKNDSLQKEVATLRRQLEVRGAHGDLKECPSVHDFLSQGSSQPAIVPDASLLPEDGCKANMFTHQAADLQQAVRPFKPVDKQASKRAPADRTITSAAVKALPKATAPASPNALNNTLAPGVRKYLKQCMRKEMMRNFASAASREGSISGHPYDAAAGYPPMVSPNMSFATAPRNGMYPMVGDTYSGYPGAPMTPHVPPYNRMGYAGFMQHMYPLGYPMYQHGAADVQSDYSSDEDTSVLP